MAGGVVVLMEMEGEGVGAQNEIEVEGFPGWLGALFSAGVKENHDRQHHCALIIVT